MSFLTTNYLDINLVNHPYQTEELTVIDLGTTSIEVTPHFYKVIGSKTPVVSPREITSFPTFVYLSVDTSDDLYVYL